MMGCKQRADAGGECVGGSRGATVAALSCATACPAAGTAKHQRGQEGEC